MTDRVIDASALAAVAYKEPGEPAVLVRTVGHQLHAPHLLRIEMASVALKKIRTAPALRDQIVAQYQA